MNSGISIHTFFLEEYIRKNLDLHIVKSPDFPKRSLEMELLSHGYTSMQNKLKHYLIENRIAEVSENPSKKGPVLELPKEYAYRAIWETKRICILRADAEDNAAVTRAIHNCITDDYEDIIQVFEQYQTDDKNKITSKTVYFYPKIDSDSNSLMSAAIRLAGKELYPDKTLSASQERCIRRLLTQKSRKQSDTRQDLIRAAYRLKMNVTEMNRFLTKAALTYALDFTDPWELQAAYLASHFPVRDDDSPMVFDIRMHELAEKNISGDSPVFLFLKQIMEQNLMHWFRQWQEQQKLGCGFFFLMDWCWYLYIYKNPKDIKKSMFKSQAERIRTGNELSAIYQKLETLVLEIPPQDWLSFLSAEPDVYMQNFPDCLMDRQFRLLQLLYRRSENQSREHISFRIQDRTGTPLGSYAPSFRENGFVHLDRNLRKVEDPERPLSRADILSLGIELYMDWEEIDRALELAGFHKLYVKDIHERALAIVLEFKNHDLSLPELSKHIQLKLQILDQLDTLYRVLSHDTRSQIEKAEPEWIRRLRKNDQE